MQWARGAALPVGRVGECELSRAGAGRTGCVGRPGSQVGRRAARLQAGPVHDRGARRPCRCPPAMLRRQAARRAGEMADESLHRRGDQDRCRDRDDHAEGERGEPRRHQGGCQPVPGDGGHQRHHQRHRDGHDRGDQDRRVLGVDTVACCPGFSRRVWVHERRRLRVWIVFFVMHGLPGGSMTGPVHADRRCSAAAVGHPASALGCGVPIPLLGGTLGWTPAGIPWATLPFR
jgi:hypothetical protein